MKSDIWYFFLFCFQLEVLRGEINDSKMFAFHNGGVQIICKHPEAIQQFKMQLLKGRQILCELTKTKKSGNMVSTVKNLEFCQPQLTNNSISFFLYNLDSYHASYYFCQLIIFDPPPYRVETFSGEYLHVHGEINDSAKPEMFAFHNGGVQIICKHPETIQQFKMRLLKGGQLLCELTKTKESGNTVSTVKNLEFCQLSNNSVSFFLYNLNSSHASYYFCQLVIFDPPPYRVETLSAEYLHVYESQLCCQLKLWLPIICAASVVLYVFGCIFICWLTKKKYQSIVHEPNSEYMSMAAVNTAKIPGPRDVPFNLELSGPQA